LYEKIRTCQVDIYNAVKTGARFLRVRAHEVCGSF
jgi:hypothetical protein